MLRDLGLKFPLTLFSGCKLGQYGPSYHNSGTLPPRIYSPWIHGSSDHNGNVVCVHWLGGLS